MKKFVYRGETALADFRSKLLPETGMLFLCPRGKIKISICLHTLFLEIVRRGSFGGFEGNAASRNGNVVF